MLLPLHIVVILAELLKYVVIGSESISTNGDGPVIVQCLSVIDLDIDYRRSIALVDVEAMTIGACPPSGSI